MTSLPVRSAITTNQAVGIGPNTIPISDRTLEVDDEERTPSFIGVRRGSKDPQPFNGCYALRRGQPQAMSPAS